MIEVKDKVINHTTKDKNGKDIPSGISTHSQETIYVEETLLNEKAIKQDNKDKLTVTVNGITYDADEQSMNYMSSVASIAAKTYNELVAIQGIPAVDAYNATYKSQINWKGADNTIHLVQIESVVEALEMAMGEIANIVGA